MDRICVKKNEKLSQNYNPSCILLFSGKRKSGKDFITSKVLTRIGEDKSLIIRLSAPIKDHWAKKHSLDLGKLLDSGDYKEQYRSEMISWSEKVRSQDYGYFCRATLEMHNANEKRIWIVSDVRRRTDLKWFREHFDDVTKTVRVVANDSVREQRNWHFTSGIDDVASECDLDGIPLDDWDVVIDNNASTDGETDTMIEPILKLISS